MKRIFSLAITAVVAGWLAIAVLTTVWAKANTLTHEILVVDVDSKEPIPDAFVVYSISEWIPGDGWTHGEHPKWHKYRVFTTDNTGIAKIEELGIPKSSWGNVIYHAVESAFSKDCVYSSTNLKNGNRLLRDGVTTIYLKRSTSSKVADQLLKYFVHMDPYEIVVDKPIARKILSEYDLSQVRPKLNLDKLSSFIDDTK